MEDSIFQIRRHRGSGALLGFSRLPLWYWIGSSCVDYARRLICQCLMRTPFIIAFKPLSYACAEIDHGGVFVKVNLFILEASPEPLNEDVVHPATFAIHADFNVQVYQSTCPVLRGELTPLISIKDFRLLASAY